MLKHIKNIDTFGRNIILVFLGTTLINVFNLFYQLLIAHRLSGADFAGFNSLLAIFMLVSAPLMTMGIVAAKYTAEFNAQNQIEKIRSLLSRLIGKISLLAVITLIVFYFTAFYITDKLKIPSVSAGYILAMLLASSWFTPVLSGALQGLELFGLFMLIAVIGGALKLALGFIFIRMGFNITGALGAFLAASAAGILISVFALKGFLRAPKTEEDVNLREFFLYLVPVAAVSFCFMLLVNIDIILVKYLFNPEDAGFYSLAQMIGKIFLFLPAAIGIVMFPKTAGLNARKMDTDSTLRRSLLYAFILCVAANLFYNLFPYFTLKVLTGKEFAESIILGRLFSVSMSFFALVYILISYFLSIKDLRFMKFLGLSAFLQILAICLFHKTLIHVQVILCVNSALMFLALSALSYKKDERKDFYNNACVQ